jgi:phosphatidylinositol 4-kinase type 2
MFVI